MWVRNGRRQLRSRSQLCCRTSIDILTAFLHCLQLSFCSFALKISLVVMRGSSLDTQSVGCSVSEMCCKCMRGFCKGLCGMVRTSGRERREVLRNIWLSREIQEDPFPRPKGSGPSKRECPGSLFSPAANFLNFSPSSRYCTWLTAEMLVRLQETTFIWFPARADELTHEEIASAHALHRAHPENYSLQLGVVETSQGPERQIFTLLKKSPLTHPALTCVIVYYANGPFVL